MLVNRLYEIIPLDTRLSVGQGAACEGWVNIGQISQHKIILTEGDTSSLIGNNPHTAVFSIRTVPCGSTRQRKTSTNSSGEQFGLNCNPLLGFQCNTIRVLPHNNISV